MDATKMSCERELLDMKILPDDQCERTVRKFSFLEGNLQCKQSWTIFC